MANFDFESKVLTPTLTKFKENDDTAIIGPVSPDVIFRQALDGDIDIVVALYHDQGLIPLKLLAFDSAVNVTVGLYLSHHLTMELHMISQAKILQTQIQC